MHVGKTGGTYVKRLIRGALDAPKLQEPQVLQDRIVLLNHCTLAEAEERFGEPSGLVITYRDPIERFVSGFYCRQRMGLPDHRARWDSGEAAAFSYFSTANDLAEALSSEDPIQHSAAHFSMHAIRHIRRGYQFHFGNPTRFAFDYASRVLACVETRNLAYCGHKIIEAVGVEVAAPSVPPLAPTTPNYPKEISDLAQSNLRATWTVEFEYFDMFRDLDTGNREA
ncbi:hypothetical protein EU803_00490 [Loktanella sp. IMCC34160]|uniref:hypothetical protein n=1 Tax=Loktanella sp. IMCC34160 TaxID=2510646 RepID=UPI00101BBBCE|nr:hypothetical protein [Loktanella sp. IMCC34160]RYG92617.1 hypothetical protein EU803_00490 [Loktanella sp. IMCC34160]